MQWTESTFKSYNLFLILINIFKVAHKLLGSIVAFSYIMCVLLADFLLSPDGSHFCFPVFHYLIPPIYIIIAMSIQKDEGLRKAGNIFWLRHL